MAQRSVPWRPKGKSVSSAMSHSKAMPRIKTWNSANVHSMMPSLSDSEPGRGVASVRGNLTANYPKIRGFNGGPSGSLQQPFVNQVGYY